MWYHFKTRWFFFVTELFLWAIRGLCSLDRRRSCTRNCISSLNISLSIEYKLLFCSLLCVCVRERTCVRACAEGSTTPIIFIVRDQRRRKLSPPPPQSANCFISFVSVFFLFISWKTSKSKFVTDVWGLLWTRRDDGFERRVVGKRLELIQFAVCFYFVTDRLFHFQCLDTCKLIGAVDSSGSPVHCTVENNC